jgi:zinc transporter 1/2/3
LLEAGIIFHSIMIGVTLGAASGSGFTTLLIVITFHQFFEGAALGARIALLYWISKARAIVMGIAFILITPVGIAIGIGVRQSFSQNGKASLLSVGILNAISAGILLYTAFKLLAHDFVDGPLKHAPVSRVLTALAALVVGLIAMSVLGKWA